MAWPELTPGLLSPISLAAIKPLKRSTCSGPTTFFTVAMADSGIIAWLLWLLTYTRLMSSGFMRYGASACNCTRYTRPALLKSLT